MADPELFRDLINEISQNKFDKSDAILAIDAEVLFMEVLLP